MQIIYDVDVIEDDRKNPKKSEFIPPDILYAQLIEKVKKYHPSADVSIIEKAFHIANSAHTGQLRKSGEPYIIHPICVATILADLELDKETIVSGLLHDVVEDTVMNLFIFSANDPPSNSYTISYSIGIHLAYRSVIISVSLK